RQDEIQRPLVQAQADNRLEEGSGELEDEGDQSDLEEAQREPVAEHRIKRRRERLHHIGEHVRGAEREEDAGRRRLHPATACRGGVSVDRRSGHGLVPRRRAAFGGPSQKIRPPKRPLCQLCFHMGASPAHCQLADGCFPVQAFTRPLPSFRRGYFGASTMVIWRPSIKGSASTLAIGAVSVRTRWRSLKPISWCAISRPRKRSVTLTLSPSSKNRRTERIFTSKSWSSMPG